MKTSAHVHSSLIRNRQFRARIACKEFGYFIEVGSKVLLLLLKGVLGKVNNFLNKISSLKHDPLFIIFTFAMIF